MVGWYWQERAQSRLEPWKGGCRGCGAEARWELQRRKVRCVASRDALHAAKCSSREEEKEACGGNLRLPS